MKKRNTGCCFIFVCLLFVVPALVILLFGFRPHEFSGLSEKKEAIRQEFTGLMGKERGVLETVKDKIVEKTTGKTWKKTDEQLQELLQAGEGMNSGTYYYPTLDSDLQAEYMAVLTGLTAMEADIPVSMDEDTMVQIVHMIFADHPELFYAEQSYNYTLYSDHAVIHPEYNCSPEERDIKEQQIEETVREAMSYIPEGASAYDCIKTLYCYVIETVDYRLDSPDNQNIYSSMVNRVSVCSGYAKELQYLLQRLGMQAFLVSGTVYDRGEHAWLIVNCDNSYYHVDPTFGDPAFSEVAEDQMRHMPPEFAEEFLYLCCDDSVIYRDRKPSDDLPVPPCTDPSLNYYPATGSYFTDAEEALISIQNMIEADIRYWEGQFADGTSYQTVKDMMQNGSISELILANHPDWPSVQIHMAYKDECRVLKLWYR